MQTRYTTRLKSYLHFGNGPSVVDYQYLILVEIEKHHGSKKVVEDRIDQTFRKNDHRIENFPNPQTIQNPYYDGTFESSLQANGRSRKNEMDPDLNQTSIVTSTQNVCYEI